MAVECNAESFTLRRPEVKFPTYLDWNRCAIEFERAYSAENPALTIQPGRMFCFLFF